MQILHFSATNFRCWDRFSIDFDPQCNVLFGPSEAGKTALLDALAIGMSNSFPGNLGSSVDGFCQRRVIDRDARDGGSVSLGFQGTHSNKKIVWSYRSKEWVWEEMPLLDSIVSMSILAGFSMTRGADCVVDWMSFQLRRSDATAKLLLSDCVKKAVRQCVPKVHGLEFHAQKRELSVNLEGGRTLRLSQLSDSYRAVIDMVAHLAWRALLANPHLGNDAATLTPGVALIDDLDAPLYPDWQRRVVADLRRTFPLLQFVITTRSPQIISSVRPQHVLKLRPGSPEPSRPCFTFGKDSNAVLTDLMETSERDAEMESELTRLARLIDDGELSDAKAAVDKIAIDLGEQDAALVRARLTIEFAERAPTDTKVALIPKCTICGTLFDGENGTAEAEACAAQGEPAKPEWFERVLQKGVYGFGEFGVSGPAKVRRATIRRDASGEHEWVLSLFDPLEISHNFSDGDSRYDPTEVPLRAVDPLCGWDFGRYVVSKADSHAELWRKVATEHYGITNLILPADKEGSVWDAIRRHSDQRG